jgi:predicted nucleic acid-binding protein
MRVLIDTNVVLDFLMLQFLADENFNNQIIQRSNYDFSSSYSNPLF